MHYTATSPNNAYPDFVSQLINVGKRVPSRNGDTLEIENFSAHFITPSLAIPPRRPGFSPLLGLMEGVQLIGQFARPGLMDAVWPAYASYTDHYGDYGDRTAYGSQVENVVKKLKASADTRQAMITLWNGLLDNDPGHSDHPCTVAIGFRIREHKLNMTVTMRSNDIWRGASSDFIQFSLLHMTVAQLVGVEPGNYYHHAHSMHLYMSDLDAAESWLSTIREGGREEYTEAATAFRPLALPGWTYAETQEECQKTLSAANREMCKTMMGQYIAGALTMRQRKLAGLDG